MRVVIVPFIDLSEVTIRALADIEGQRGERSRVLAVDNGSTYTEGRRVKEYCLGESFYIRHNPPLPTLNATWNWGAEQAFRMGADRVFILNNDIRLPNDLFDLLDQAMEKHDALFVSAIGRKELQPPEEFKIEQLDQKGGPDYSCFLMSKECWEKYPFDSQFTYFGDLDHHRRIMLGGDGDRIFSVNLPYIHYGSQTINRSPEVAERYRRIFDAHKQRYVSKWGGDANQEKWNSPENDVPTRDGVCTTTPDLQSHRCAGFHPDGDIQPSLDVSQGPHTSSDGA